MCGPDIVQPLLYEGAVLAVVEGLGVPGLNGGVVAVEELSATTAPGVTPAVAADGVVHGDARVLVVDCGQIGVVRGIRRLLVVVFFQLGMEA